MKADRLVATLLLLQTRHKVTAAEVAAELEVSERTARRDLEALSAAGIPVYSQTGRAGGWMLLGGARTDLSGLTAGEARALFSVAGPAADATPELKAALRKLVRALPEPFRDSAQTTARSIVIDPGHWGQTHRSFRPEHLDALQSAVSDGERVRLGYRNRERRVSTRVVSPLGLVVKGTVWYLVANTDEGLRTFRVGRVSSADSTGEPVDRPDGFDLAAAWERIVENVDELRSPHEVSLLANADLIPMLRWVFGRGCQVDDDTSRAADERVPVRLRGQDVERIVVQLAGFAGRVEVLAPTTARESLRRIGDQLLATYA